MRFSRLRLIALAALLPTCATAVTFNVNDTADRPDDIHDGVCADAFGKCTLRAAIMEANLGGTGVLYVINLPAGTYTLTRAVTSPDDHSNGDLDVNVAVTIQGAGAAKTIIDANHLDRAFKVSPSGYFELDDLTIRNGQPSAFGGRETLGGAVYAQSSVHVFRCVLDSNTSANSGGAISMSGFNTPTLTAANTTFSRNSSTYDGGGLYALQSDAYFDSCTFDSNTSGTGGGIWATAAHVYMVNSTFYQNQALYSGGGLWVYGSTVRLHNVTLGGNVADSDADGVGQGGGLYVSGTSTTVVMNSVFANLNASTHGNDDCATGSTTVQFSAGNVLRSVSGCTYSGLVYEGDPLLGLLKDNGGRTRTEMPSPSSLAINGGPAGGCLDYNGFTITVDQRGVKRPIGSACDLGATELEPIGDANGDGVVNVNDVFYLINYLFAGGSIPKGRGNVNGGSTIDVADVFYLINYLFAGGPAPI